MRASAAEMLRSTVGRQERAWVVVVDDPNAGRKYTFECIHVPDEERAKVIGAEIVLEIDEYLKVDLEQRGAADVRGEVLAYTTASEYVLASDD